MRTGFLCVFPVAAIAAVACSKQENAAQARQDVVAAQQEGQQRVAEAKADAREEVRNQSNDAVTRGGKAVPGDTPGPQAADASNPAKTATLARHDVAITEAKALHKVAVAKCEALPATEQRGCKSNADAELNRAKKQARRERDLELQKIH